MSETGTFRNSSKLVDRPDSSSSELTWHYRTATGTCSTDGRASPAFGQHARLPLVNARRNLRATSARSRRRSESINFHLHAALIGLVKIDSPPRPCYCFRCSLTIFTIACLTSEAQLPIGNPEPGLCAMLEHLMSARPSPT